MNTAPALSSLARLRAKTDRQLTVLLRRELERGLSLVNQSRPCDAKRSYKKVEMLLAIAELPGPERDRLQRKLDCLREALSQRAMSAA